MSFMDKVKFWKKDDEFSFNDSSDFGSDSFSSSADASVNSFADPSSSGLPPDPMLGGSSSDPYSSDFLGDSASSDPYSSNSMGSGSSNSYNSKQSQSYRDPIDSSSASDPFGSSQNTQDPFARPTAPPKQATIGQSLAHKYMQGEQQSAAPVSLPSNPLKPGSEIEMISLKLDAIRSELNAVSQRMMRLEHLIEEQNKKRGW
jgi:hypothetical protein